MGELVTPINPDRAPIFIGAGIIKTQEENAFYDSSQDLAVQVKGSYSMDEYGGNDSTYTKTVFHWDPKTQSAWNAIGLRNPGRKEAGRYTPESIKEAHDNGQVVILGVTPLRHEDAAEVAPDLVEWAMDDMGADGVEINFSCPNEGSHPVLCLDVEKSFDVMERARQRIGQGAYMIAKMSPLSPLIIAQYKRGGFGADAISSGNNCLNLSPPLQPGQGNQRVIEVNDGYAGQSGPIISDKMRLNLVHWASYDEGDPNAKQFDTWSIGGIADGGEVFDRIHNLKAELAGGAQAFYRADDPAALIELWSKQYFAAKQTALAA